MSEVAKNLGTATDNEKPVQVDDVKFPPFPDPTEEEFEDDIGDEERSYYKEKFADLNIINSMKLHCSACDRHLGSSTKNESRMRAHPMLRTLVCHTCHTFYNSGEFEKGDDGSELYCRWCGQGGQVYCCSNCPHVFCAKCVKRNLGIAKIREIENTDDWKCFKCNSRCLWDLRALCWALLRYCDLKNKITYKTEDPKLKEAYQKDCSIDHTECCKNKPRRREKTDTKAIKKETDSAKKSAASTAIARIPATIQVKKFASINLDDSPKEKKPMKRPASPVKPKPYMIKSPIPINQPQKILLPNVMPPLKKIRMPMMTNPIRINPEKPRPNTYSPQSAYTRIRPKPPIPMMPTHFNGFPNNNTFNSGSYGNMYNNISDNINLSLESLTQGLDMAAVVAMSNNNSNVDNDVVCTPDFPLEPLCEVMEDNADDDVQCITPAPAAKPTATASGNSTSLISRMANTLPDVSTDNIIQMTDDDVTVNTVTGGLKFRVDPQTLSSNKMYRLPDGRIFAINANPSMPGGYSATIVAVTETSGKTVSTTVPKGATYAAKLSAVSSVQSSTPKLTPINNNRASGSKANILRKTLSTSKRSNSSIRDTDMHVSVEWYRFNLIEAIDSLEYSLGRLEKLKKQATTVYLRQRSVDEMRNLHRTLERVLNTSSTRFNEIRENLNKELKQFILRKTGGNVSDDDDDVEILPDLNDDPIFIDENSADSNDCVESQEVDLTGVGSSDHNDSVENKDDNEMNNVKDTTPTEDEPKNYNVDSKNDNEDLKNDNEDPLNDNEDPKNDDEGSKNDNESPIDDDNISVSSSSKNETAPKEVENIDKPVDSKEENSNKIVDNDVVRDNDSPLESNDSESNHQLQTNGIPLDTNENMAEAGDKSEDREQEKTIKEQDDCNDERTKDDEMETDGNVEQVSDNDMNEKSVNEEDLERGDGNIAANEHAKESKEEKQDSELSESTIENILKGEDKTQDPDISDEMIETLLKDDNVDEIDNILNHEAMDVV